MGVLSMCVSESVDCECYVLISMLDGGWLVVASWVLANSLNIDMVLRMLRLLLCGVCVVGNDCLVCCRMWRIVGVVWCACFFALCGAGAIRVGGFSDLSWLV